jgi:hypothetical protein
MTVPFADRRSERHRARRATACPVRRRLVSDDHPSRRHDGDRTALPRIARAYPPSHAADRLWHGSDDDERLVKRLGRGDGRASGVGR